MMTAPHPDPDRIALGVKQPWAELILRGVKTIEVRSQNTNVRGPIYIYTSRRIADIEPARNALDRYELDPEQLVYGRLVGSVDIVDSQPGTADDAAASCVPSEFLENNYGWQLANPVRFDEPLTVRFLPYGVWFYPFKRRQKTSRRTRRSSR